MNVRFLKQGDRFLGKLSSFFLKKQKAAAPEHLRKIAVIRLWAIGESLLTLPAIKALKEQWPESEIAVITTPRVEPVFAGQKFIDEVTVIQPTSAALLRAMFQHRKVFDVVIDFEPYFYVSALLARVIGKYSIGFDTLTRGRMYSKAVPYRDDQHVVKTNFDLVRALPLASSHMKSWLHYDLRNSTLSIPAPRAKSPKFMWLRSLTVAIAPGGRVDFRRWPAERFAKVADYLKENYQADILLVGDEADVPILKEVQNQMKKPAQIVSDLSLAEVANLLSSCRLTIANDGGLMHVSASVGTPTLGLFGPETPVRMGPYGPKNRALYHQLEDNPIINVSRGEVPGMLHTEGDLSRYVRAITVDEVIAASTSLTEMARIS